MYTNVCVCVLSFFLFLLTLRLLSCRHGDAKKKSTQLPPSTIAIPFLGHPHLLKKSFHTALARLAALHGPVFSLRLGSRNAIVVSSAPCARECFTDHDVPFANRPLLPSLLLISFGGAMLTTSRYGPYWRNLRRIASVHRVSSMSGDISAEARAMARRLSRAAAAALGGAALVDLKRTLFEVSLSTLMEAIAQTKASRTEVDADTDMSPEAQEFKKSLDELVPLVGTANLWDYLPVLRWPTCSA